jgi:hypothetical protein
MIVATKFNLMQMVRIPAIEASCIILKIQIETEAIFYRVEYWLDGKRESVWLPEQELTIN